jgi:hypothetical protein
MLGQWVILMLALTDSLANNSQMRLSRSRKSRFDLPTAAATLMFLVGSVAFTTAEVVAQVVSAKARYNQGILIVRGRTAEPRQFVSLGGVLIQRSNRVGRFVFRQTRLPPTCAVSLRAEGQEVSVPIRNCPLAG